MSAMEAELAAAAALAMEAPVFCSSVMTELGFWIAVRVSAAKFRQHGHPATKHIAKRFFCLREVVDEGKTSIRHVPTETQLADIVPKKTSKHRVRFLIGNIKNFRE